MLEIFKKLLGSKEKKDEKIFRPYIDKVNAEFSKLSGLSNDQLRDKTLDFKSRIQAYVKSTEDEIDALKKQVDDNPKMDFQTKDELFKLCKARSTGRHSPDRSAIWSPAWPGPQGGTAG